MPISLARVAAALTTVLLLATGVAQAQSDTAEARRKAAEQLVRTVDQLSGPERMMGNVKGMMQGSLLQNVRNSSHLSAAQQERAADLMATEMTAAIGDLMKEMLPAVYAAMVDVYVQRFSLAEINALQRFYDSSAGRKATTVMIEDMPRLMQPMMQSLQAQGPRIEERMKGVIERLRAEGIDLKPPPR
jgi:hypothetical protein